MPSYHHPKILLLVSGVEEEKREGEGKEDKGEKRRRKGKWRMKKVQSSF